MSETRLQRARSPQAESAGSPRAGGDTSGVGDGPEDALEERAVGPASPASGLSPELRASSDAPSSSESPYPASELSPKELPGLPRDVRQRLLIHGSPRRTPLDKLAEGVRRYGALAVSLLLLGAHLARLYSSPNLRLAQGFQLAVLLHLLLLAGWRWWAIRRGKQVDRRHDLALGLAVLAAVFAAIAISGGAGSPLYPLLYLFAALASVLPIPRSLSLTLVGVAVLQNVAAYALEGSLNRTWPLLATQTGFILIFALFYHLLLSSRLWLSQAAESEAVKQRLAQAREEARALRLGVIDKLPEPLAQLGKAPGEALEHLGELDERLLFAQVLELNEAVGSLLDGAQLALNCDAIAFYVLSTEQGELWLREGRCRQGELATGPFAAGEGVLGTVLHRGRPQLAVGNHVDAQWRGESPFQKPEIRVQAMAALPVLEKMPDSSVHLRGVLVADRLQQQPFVEHEQRFLSELASQIVRMIEAERLVGVIHRSRAAQLRLGTLGAEFNDLSTPEEVAQLATSLARELVASLDLAAVTQAIVEQSQEVDGARDEVEPPRIHRVLSAEGPKSAHYADLEFSDNDGLVSSAVRYGEVQPAGPQKPPSRLRVFDERIRTPASLRIFPLQSGGHIHGTLCVWSRRNGVLDKSALAALEVLSTLCAGALGRVLAAEGRSDLGMEALKEDEASLEAGGS